MKRFSSLFGALAVLLLLALPLAVSAEEACDHEWTGMPTVAATCTEPGTTGGQWCSKCHFVLVDPTQNADPTGHDYVPVTDLTQKCSKCGDILGQPLEETAASGTCGDNATWKMDGYGNLVISGSGTVVSEGLPDKAKVTSLEVRSGITGISDYAFKGFSNMTTATVAGSVQSIGSEAFRNCTSLQSISVPFVGTSPNASGIKATFGAIFGISSTNYTSDEYILQRIDDQQYYSFIPHSLRSVTVTNAGKIGASAFISMQQLTSLTLNEGITEFGYRAFYQCGGLTALTIPSTVEIVGPGAFGYCKGLTELTFPAGLTQLGYSVLQDSNDAAKVIFLGDAPACTVSTPFFRFGGTVSYHCERSGWDSFREKCKEDGNQWDVIHPKDSIVPLDKVEPTCTADGLTAGSKCNACGEFLIPQETIDKLPHTLGQEHKAKPATYVSDGNNRYFDCTGCDKKLDADGNELSDADIVIPKREDEVEWNMRWEGDCVVWDPVEGADGYSADVYMVGAGFFGMLDVSGTSTNIKEYFENWGPGTYYIKVTAYFGNGYITSPRSPEKVYKAPVVDLGEPSNAVWDGTVARWDAAEHAEKYIVTLYKVGIKNPIFDPFEIEETEVDFGTEFFEYFGSGSYYFEVESYRAQNYKGPAVSNKKEYTAEKDFPKVQNVHWDGYVAKWDPVENAQGYDIMIAICGDTISYYSTHIWETSLDFSGDLAEYGCGQYSFEVAVYLNNDKGGWDKGGWSDTSDTLDYHKSIQNFPKEDATCTKSGVTAWSKCNACHEVVTPKKTIDKLPHTYDASWVCTVCGDEHTHALGKKHGVKAATDTANGNIEYYDCVGFGDGCDLKLDADGNELADVVIPAAKTVKLSATACTYDGKVQTPSVIAKDSKGNILVKGTDYTVSYASGRKAVGTYKVVVKGKGNYSFTKTLTFKINPAKTAISKLTAAQKAFTVKWAKKTAQVSGYQIQYSLKKDFSSGNKLVTVKGMNNVSKTIKNLLAGKTYFVRVRTFKTVDGKNYTSAWSAVKSIKTLK